MKSGLSGSFTHSGLHVFDYIVNIVETMSDYSGLNLWMKLKLVCRFDWLSVACTWYSKHVLGSILQLAVKSAVSLQLHCNQDR